METSVEIIYTCGQCQVIEASVMMRPRGANENILEWMHDLTSLLQEHHIDHSPNCRAKSFSIVKIPFAPGSSRVGGPTVN